MGQDHRGRARAKGGQGGMTLVEVAVAASILLIVLIPTAYLISGSAGLVTSNKTTVTASQLATSQLEADRAYADTATWTGSPAAPPVPWPTVMSGPSGIAYTITRSYGWCMITSTASTWTTTATGSTVPSFPNGMVAYKEVVTVAWKKGSFKASQLLQVPESVITANSIPTSVPNGSCPT